ncbi:MAG: hypothetical protein AB1Z98_33515 [Nannocystaceae bacterium]
MTVSPIDPTPYLRTPRVGVASGLSLSKMLLTRVPPRPGPGVLWAARALAAAVTSAEEAWRAKGTEQSTNARPADLRVDRAWGAVQRRLADYELFAPDDADRQRAAELGSRLFPTGLDFLALPWVQEHAQSERRLQIIDEEDLRDDLDRLVSPWFVTELVEAHAAYGEALGITTAQEPASRVSMIEPLRALTQAIGDYALQVVAYARVNPEHGEAAQRALAPIDMFREAASRSRRTNGADAEDDAEVPAVDDDFVLPEGAPAPDAPLPVVAAAE